ncbi:unnamed protein product [Trichobilharzia regenti]|nr:unnamed protein product [Trichobilharzia regenti]
MYVLRRLGGVLPPVAAELHKKHIESVVLDAVSKSNIRLQGVEDYILLGTALDASPGDVLDKVSFIAILLSCVYVF